MGAGGSIDVVCREVWQILALALGYIRGTNKVELLLSMSWLIPAAPLLAVAAASCTLANTNRMWVLGDQVEIL